MHFGDAAAVVKLDMLNALNAGKSLMSLECCADNEVKLQDRNISERT